MSQRVREGVDAGLFEDGRHLAQIESELAKRFLHAVEAHKTGGLLSESWEIALAAVKRSDCALMQGLLLCMNAQFYLDLGLVSADAMRGKVYDLALRDFMKLSEIRWREFGVGVSVLLRHAPVCRLLLHGVPHAEYWFFRPILRHLRESPWDFGKRLTELDPAYWAVTVADRDALVAELASLIASPQGSMWLLLKCARLGESRDIAKFATLLAEGTESPS
jgi:hypothetical protein